MVLRPTGPGLSLLLVSVILLAFSWITVALRMWARLKIKSLGTDDYLMFAGLVSSNPAHKRSSNANSGREVGFYGSMSGDNHWNVLRPWVCPGAADALLWRERRNGERHVAPAIQYAYTPYADDGVKQWFMLFQIFYGLSPDDTVLIRFLC